MPEERARGYSSLRERPTLDIQRGITTPDPDPFPTPTAAQEPKGGRVEPAGQPGQDIVIVITSHRDSEDPRGAEPPHPSLERARRFVETIVLVDDIATQEEQIDLLADRMAHDPIPA
jgi:hypothetical protein